MNILEEIESLLQKVAYKPRIQRQHRVRGIARNKSRMNYRRNKMQVKKRMKIYRRKFKNLLKARRRRPSYKRVG